MRRIDIGQVDCNAAALDVSHSGEIYVAKNPPFGKHVAEIVGYAATFKSSKPTLRLHFRLPTQTPSIQSLSVDAVGNIYALVSFSSSGEHLLCFCNADQKPKELFSGKQIESFALSERGTIYISSSGFDPEVSEYSADGKHLLRKVAGGRTQLDDSAVVGIDASP
jgi:hypothetical protein